MLLAHVPGDDWYDAEPADRHLIATDAHRVQLASLTEVDALVAAGVPDRRGGRLLRLLHGVAARHGNGVPGLAELVGALPARLAAVAACGVPDALVHGDLHPGNVRVTGPGAGGRTLVDWGDCCVAHPAFDVLRLAEGLAPAQEEALLAAWARGWRAAVPGCDPVRAADLLRPVAALRAAATYADFVANIEPSERPFHAADVPAWLGRAVAAAAVGTNS
jgi:aminoglycoside phosphotransferase (APT) family kinase protein